MAVKYNKLFKLMIDKKMSNAELIQKAGFSANIMTRLKKDEYVSMESIEKICTALECNVDDVLEKAWNKGFMLIGTSRERKPERA